MSEPLRGKALLKAAINQIILHPETWNQKQWHSQCGTKHCVAGWCQLLAGLEEDDCKASDEARKSLRICKKDANFLFSRNIGLGEIYAFAKNMQEIKEGFDEEGFDQDGYNEYGYNKKGLDRNGNLPPLL